MSHIYGAFMCPVSWWRDKIVHCETRVSNETSFTGWNANSLLALIASMSSVFTLASCRWPSIVSRNFSCAILRSGFLGRPSSSRFSNGIFGLNYINKWTNSSLSLSRQSLQRLAFTLVNDDYGKHWTLLFPPQQLSAKGEKSGDRLKANKRLREVLPPVGD